MRAFVFSLLSVCLLTITVGCAGPSEWVRVDDPALGPPNLEREFRGLWVATVANIDWPSEPGLSADQQKAEAREILDLAVGLKLNTIVLQVRPAADALYESKHEPWSAFLAGQQGVTPGYDPLEYWIDEAHARGLDLHAWVNPFRAWHPSTPGEPDPASVAATQPDFLVRHGDYFWMDPGNAEARERSLMVLRDIVRRYDIDGLHVDDYFYPYPIEGEPFGDERSFSEYTSNGGSLNRSNWRRWNIDQFVRDMYAQTKRVKPNVLVGISPFGIWRPGHPEQVVGFDAYEDLAADARRWLREGWLDYASPQLYWKIDSEGQPFEPLLDWWTGQNSASRHVWPGLYLTRIKADDGWAPGDITDQIKILQSDEAADGFVLFSAVGLVENRQGINAEFERVVDSSAAVPESHWLPNAPLPKPWLRIKRTNCGYAVRFARSQVNNSVLGWVLWTRYGDQWSSRFVSRDSKQILLPLYEAGEPLLAIATQSWAGSGRYSEPVCFHRLIPPPAIPSSEINSAE